MPSLRSSFAVAAVLGSIAVACASTSAGEGSADLTGAAPGAYDWRDAVVYFVFVDRFANGDPSNDRHVDGVSAESVDYQGGDWKGVTQKIEEGYFNQLGVNTLWVTVPIQNAAVAGRGAGGDDHTYSGYHGYWPKLDSADPTKLEAEDTFGTIDELKTLVDTAHAKGLKVLFDYAMVHVHASSAVFQQHPDWFWPNAKDGHDCICGQACSWDDDYQRCWFTDYLPHWNYTNPEARAWSVDNAVAWVKQTGVDGFRADAIKHIDSSWLNELRTKIASEVTAAQPIPERFYMVGETYDFGNRDFIKSFVDPRTKLDGQFDFPLRAKLVDAMLLRRGKMGDLASFMDSNDGFYGPDAIMSTFIGNHDLPRIIHLAEDAPLWGEQWSDGKDRAWSNQPGAVAERNAFERVANAFALLYTNRGVPLVYYGDEIGLPGAGDPDNRRPMQWSGLTEGQTFLRDRIARLGQIRAAHPALRRGTRSTLSSANDTWVYAQKTEGDTVYVAVNRGDGEQPVTGLPAGRFVDLVRGDTVESAGLTVPARQTRILVAR